MQKPVDKKGSLYGKFKTYDAVDPDKFELSCRSSVGKRSSHVLTPSGPSVSSAVSSSTWHFCGYSSISRPARSSVAHLVSTIIHKAPGSYTTRDFFPHVRVKYGDASVMKWSLEGSYASYLSTSFDGTVTGMRGKQGYTISQIRAAG